MKKFSLLIFITLLVPFTALFADEEVEEVVVTGSQIKGAKLQESFLLLSFLLMILKQLDQKMAQSYWKI